MIHSQAIVDPNAILAEDVTVGPWSIIGPDVEIGPGCIIEPHVVIRGPTRIGAGNHIYQFSSIGEATPDLKYQNEPTRLLIGNNNVIRENVTIHRGTVQDRSETTIGDDNLIMSYVHIGHDSVIGNHTVLVNNCALAGHVIASTLLNPAPWLFWLVIASPLLLRSWNRSPGEGVVFVCLIFLTNIGTASALAWAASHGRKLLDPNWQRRSLKVVGVVLILAGAFLCWQATVGNFQSLIDQQEIIRSVVEEGISTR